MRAFRPDLAGASSIIDAARKDVQEYMMRPDEEYMRAFRAALDIHPIRRDPPQRRAQTARGHGERPMSVPTHGLQSAYLDAMDLCARPTSSPVFGQRSSAWGAEAPEAARKKPDYPPPIDLGALMPTKPNSPRGTPPSARSPRAKGQRHRRRGGRYLSKGDKPSMSPSYKPFVPPEGDIISARLRDGPRPWAQWPFVPVAKVADLTPSAGEKPGACTAPFACETTHNRVRLSWEASPPEEAISGYEVEICEIDALRGVQVWRRVHRGPTLECPAAFGRGVSGVRARVRAYNGKGKGEWSPVSTVIKLPQPPGPPRVEIDEIPGSWLAIDLAGLDEFKEHNDPSFMAATKEELLQAMYTARTLIKVAFRYYALAGVSNIDDDPNTMTMVQFGNFVKGASLFGTTLATSDVDRIFLRAVRSIPPGSDKQGGTGGAEAIGAPNLLSAASSTALKVSKEWRKVKAAVGITSLLKSGPATMSQPQFVQALIRMAAHKFADAPHFSLGEKFERLLSLHVAEHILNELSLIEDDFAPKMRGHLMGAVLEMHQRNLKHVFNAYAAADTSNTHARHTTATMNVKECFELCEDVGVFDKAFTTRHLLIAFVKVNIDDDVYVQVGGAPSSVSTPILSPRLRTPRFRPSSLPHHVLPTCTINRGVCARRTTPTTPLANLCLTSLRSGSPASSSPPCGRRRRRWRRRPPFSTRTATAISTTTMSITSSWSAMSTARAA